MIEGIIAYFQFFTRLVIPVDLKDPMNALKKGTKYLPLFGLLLGMIEGIVYYVSSLFLNTLLAFLMVLFFDVLFTGAMHQDGLADMADGLYSSRKKERMLEIMKDSRIGTMGALALIFYYSFMISIFLSYQPLFDGADGAVMIVAMNLLAKSNLTLLFYKMTYASASSSGLGKTWEDIGISDIIIAQLSTIILFGFVFRWNGAIIYTMGVVFTFIYRGFVYKKVEGLNGDTMGALAPLSNVVFLLSICALGGV